MKNSDNAPETNSGSSPDRNNTVDCFFISGLEADGKPYSYRMHKYLGIRGGTGPTGSIESKGVNINVPRSKKAFTLHMIGFFIKVVFFAISLIVFKPGFLPEQGFITKIFISFCIICLGGLVTLIFYQANKTRSKFFFTGSYPVIKEYKKKGYKRGFNPMISTTPVGIIFWLLRLIF